MDFIVLVVYISIYIGLVATTFYILTFVSSKDDKEKMFKEHELPTVSVLIPVLNEEKSIVSTLNSILKSDYPLDKLEVIVIDNNSTDNTNKLVREFIEKRNKIKRKTFKIKLYIEKNPGKGNALNLGISKAKGEIVFSMDADTFVEPWSLKNMVRYFKNPEVMCVSPGITIYNPRNILQRVQYIEYVIGLFLRKTFAILNAIHITPGAFSAYRKSFLTDMEVMMPAI